MGARLKLERANKHIQGLNLTVTAYLNNHVRNTYIERNKETGGEHLRFDPPNEPIPNDIVLILGDALHNMRCALDHLVVEIIGIRNIDRRHTNFPIRETRKDLIATVNGGIRKKLPSMADFIIHKVRSYKSGNPALWNLHKLDNIDKHNLLITTVSQIGVSGISATTATGLTVKNMSLFTVRKRGKLNSPPITAISSVKNIEVADYGQPLFDVRFGNGQPYQGQSVLPTLHSIYEEVLNVIEAAESFFS